MLLEWEKDHSYQTAEVVEKEAGISLERIAANHTRPKIHSTLKLQKGARSFMRP